ncbi:hypothetical protein [Streptomyces sp. CFMR 7]|uniref:hypothetical protein n=1 Tax=Streptomyces sp. CFMR 7 TaxID=1649184 RepID=UPI0011A69C58|nr:hypothetical protein [Streptomyces sp. CFMR 7]
MAAPVVGGADWLLVSVVELDEVQVADGHCGLLLIVGQCAEEVGLSDGVGEDAAQFIVGGFGVPGVEEAAGVGGGEVFGDVAEAVVGEFAGGGGVGEAGVELGGDAAVVVKDLAVRLAAGERLPAAVDLAFDELGVGGGEVLEAVSWAQRSMAVGWAKTRAARTRGSWAVRR